MTNKQILTIMTSAGWKIACSSKVCNFKQNSTTVKQTLVYRNTTQCTVFNEKLNKLVTPHSALHDSTVQNIATYTNIEKIEI